jgi:deoxyribose-phosphate aldolase
VVFHDSIDGQGREIISDSSNIYKNFMLTTVEIAKLIDHAVLHPIAGMEEIKHHAAIVRKHNVASICVKPYAVSFTRDLLKGSDVLTGTVIGFPHGNSAIPVKAYETQKTIDEGAEEIDMVINIAKALEHDWNYISEEVSAIRKVTKAHEILLKVIFETDYLTGEEEKIRLCHICNEVGVDYVKTSTGFGYVSRPEGGLHYIGATIKDVKLMRAHSNPEIGVKASGGIRSLKDLLGMVDAGANRIGTSATEEILKQATIETDQ